jgi:hypothetical protein
MKVAFTCDSCGEPVLVGQIFVLQANGDKSHEEEFFDLGEAHTEKYDDWCRYVATADGKWVKPNVITLPMTADRLVVGQIYSSRMGPSRWKLMQMNGDQCILHEDSIPAELQKPYECRVSAFVKWINNDPDHWKA